MGLACAVLFTSLRRPLGRIWRCKDVEDPFKQCSQRGVPLQVGMVSNLVTGNGTQPLHPGEHPQGHPST